MSEINTAIKESLWESHPEIAQLLIYNEEGFKYTKSNSRKVKWKCPDCSHVNQSQINRLINNTKCKSVPIN